MNDRDERRSRVPAGTFGSSSAPPPRPAPATPPETAAANAAADRRRFVKTLSGEEEVPRPEGLEELDAKTAAERQKSQVSTLLGHPPTPPVSQTLPGAGAPQVLAPPKWRGAGAYMQGDEPQPRISSIPVPPPMVAPTKPVGVPIGVMRSQVKTKMGQPLTQRAAQEIPASEPPPPPPDDTLKDTIQQMLEQQASVPIEVEETSAEGIPELALDDLLDDEPVMKPSASSDADTERPPSGVHEADTERPPAGPPSEPLPHVVSAPPEAGGSERRRKLAVQVSAALAESEAQAAESSPGGAKKADGEAAKPRPKDAPASEPKRRIERRPASSLIPAEVTRRGSRSDSEAKAGLLFLAAMVAVGGGGWWLTRGTYNPAMHVRPPSAAAATAEQSAPAAQPAVTPGATPAAATGLLATPAAPETKVSEPESGQPRNSRRTRSSDSAEEAEPPVSERGESERGVLTVTPRAEGPQGTAELPDSPTRENVIATLGGLRAAFAECAQGQRGVAQLDITLVDSGAVSHVVVGGDFAGSPQGSCIARAARAAQFAPFKKPRFRLVYPISL